MNIKRRSVNPMPVFKSVRVLAGLLSVALLFCACAKPSMAPPSETMVIEAMPALTPQAVWRFDAQACEAHIQDIFFGALRLPFEAPDDLLAPLIEQGLGVYAAMEHVPLFRETAVQTHEQLRLALAETEALFISQFDDIIVNGQPVRAQLSTQLSGETDWRSMLAFLRSSAMIGKPSSALFQRALQVDIAVSYDEPAATVNASLQVSVLPFRDMWAKATDNTRDLMAGKLCYAYLLTVYNDDGQMQGYREPKDASAHLSHIASPLTGNIRKTWFADRDKGTRRHTGIDILAPEDTPIYSCTDGIVTHIAYGTGAGNYVVITDAKGYEYHYYHMVRLTDFLREGDAVLAHDLVGHVGNTGNSSANHLHLSILHPNGQYINPYPYVVNAKP